MNCYDQLANKIEVHLTLDDSPGYYLTKDDQKIIINSLRFAGRWRGRIRALAKFVKVTNKNRG